MDNCCTARPWQGPAARAILNEDERTRRGTVQDPSSFTTINRRGLMRRGAKLAYVVPAVVVAMRVHEAYAGPPKKKGGSPFSSPPSPR